MPKVEKRLKRTKKLAAKNKQSLTKKHQINRDANRLSKFGNAEVSNPYLNDSDLEVDLDLADVSMREYFGDVPDDFSPPFLSEESTSENIILHPWNAVFRDKMIYKYGSLKKADPYLRYSMFQFMALKMP